MTEFLDIPDVVLRNVVKNLDMESVLTLRKVNKGLRLLADREKIDFQIEIFTLFVTSDGAYLTIMTTGNNVISIVYYAVDVNKTSVTVGHKSKMIEMNFAQACCNDIKIVLHNQKSISEELRLFLMPNHNNPEVLAPFMRDLGDIFKLRDHRIQTITFGMRVMDQDQVMMVLPHLCPETLRSFRIQSYNQNLTVLEINNIVNTAQWENIVNFKTVYIIIVLDSMRCFSRISQLDTTFWTLKTDDLLVLKEIMMENGILRNYRLGFMRFEDEGRLVEVLGEPTYAPIDDTKVWEFGIPRNPHLRARISWTNIFVRISCSAVS